MLAKMRSNFFRQIKIEPSNSNLKQVFVLHRKMIISTLEELVNKHVILYQLSRWD